MLAEKKHFWQTMRLWAAVLPSNVLGALAFAALATLTGALSPEIVHSLSKLGVEAIQHTPGTIFWSGVMGGWIIATVAWLVSGSHSITGSVLIIWLLAPVVGLGNFAHCIAARAKCWPPSSRTRSPGGPSRHGSARPLQVTSAAVSAW